jgi:hypothetical protein
MLELSVAASHDDAAPAVGFDQSDHVANIHCHNPNLISTQRRPVTRPETLATVPPEDRRHQLSYSLLVGMVGDQP